MKFTERISFFVILKTLAFLLQVLEGFLLLFEPLCQQKGLAQVEGMTLEVWGANKILNLWGNTIL